MKKYVLIPLFLLLTSLSQSFNEHAADTHINLSEKPIFRTNSVWRFAYSPDGKTIVCASVRGRIVVYNTANGQELARLRGHTGGVHKIAYSPDGKTIACASSDRSVYLWDAETAKLINKIGGERITRETTRISAENQRIWGLAYSPDARMLATGGSNGSVYLWDAETAKPINNITKRNEHPVTVTTVRFSPDGKMLVSESSDGTVFLWRIPFMSLQPSFNEYAADTQIHLLDGPILKRYPIWCVAYSPDGSRLAAASVHRGYGIWVYDAQTAEEIAHLPVPTDQIRSIGYSPDGKTLAGGSKDGKIFLWDAKTGRLLNVLTGPDRIRSIGYSPDGKTLASGSFGGRIFLWDTDAGKLLKQFSGHSATVTSVVYSSDGKTLASRSSNYIVFLWKIASE